MADVTTTGVSPCPYCATVHVEKCALVKAIEYHQDGTAWSSTPRFSSDDYPGVLISEEDGEFVARAAPGGVGTAPFTTRVVRARVVDTPTSHAPLP